ncbi:hypothetical protein MKW98_018038 [Papaver atlanticum]|uniref:Protein kinase domain-containing protein n=1 Tax=Papaver atlanticum TaxID=357466 RepID=A0AAD4TCM0_9MAGN|nr:hypothetical protein MKW98_018038 [Papaver atlanticum]
MGCFPCFDSKEEEKLNPGNKEESSDNVRKEVHHNHNNQPVVNPNVAKLSSGADRLRSRSTLGGSRRESSGPKEGPYDHIAAQTFTFRELAAATKNFRPESLLGEGGFGRVYRGFLESTGQAVAVKQLDKDGLQGNREFLVEVLMLSLLHHQNLVSLIGYCADGDQRLLVYEFMCLGSLEDHLHDLPPDKEALDWNTRMKIAAGAAKELITGRKAIDSTQGHGEQNLVQWARPMFNDRRKFPKLVDPRLEGRFPMRGLYQALAVASMCIQESAATRPLIGDVVTALSYLASQSYDPNAPPSNKASGEKEDRRTSNERGGRIGKNEEGGGSGRKWDLEGSEKDDSPRETQRMLNRDLDRERAVAEAKMWGENWREKKRQSAQGSFDGVNG